MQRGRKIVFAKAAVILTAIPAVLWSLSGGPEPGRAGVPGEGNCTFCHTGTVNSGPGSVTITFPGPLEYTPGVTQRLTVQVSDPSQVRSGFQLTARLAGDATRQAGSFSPIGPETQVICSTPPFAVQAPPPCPAGAPLQYIEHTSTGSMPGNSTFTFDWTPPAEDVGPVTLYVAGNAANGVFSVFGDRIYTSTYTLNPAGAAAGRPAVTTVAEGAGFQPVVSGGSWVSILGANLAPATRTWRADEIVEGALPTALDGVSVTINDKPAAVFFISPTQLNVLAQPDDAAGPVPVVVTTAGGSSDVFTVQMAPAAPAFFLWESRYAVATRPDFTYIGPPNLFEGITTTPARPGEIVVLWGTGFGPTVPPAPANRVVESLHHVSTPPVVRIGGMEAEFIYAVLTPGNAGVYQIGVRIPAAAPAGDLPVVAEVGGVSSPAEVFIAVQP